MPTRSISFRDNFKSYLFVASLGLLAGILTRLSDFFPYDTLWSFSSIATLFGFWMVTAALVIYFSCSNKNAAINVFLYLFSMSFSFYFLKFMLGLFLPSFSDEGFNWHLFLLYDIFALVCGAIGYVLYFWNKGTKLSSLLYALPPGGLAAETIGVGLYLYRHHSFLFQLVFDFLSLLILGCCFYKKSGSKLIYITTVGSVALLGYFLFYRPFI